MNNYINPYLLIKELYLEATTLYEKSLAILFGLFVAGMASIIVTGVVTVFYELITNPSTFNNATWGIFDTLG